MKAYVASHLKDMNRQKVYKVLSECECTSKAEIARTTGISAPTVIKIINFLMEKGLVEELGDGESSLGRKPQLLRLNKNRYYAVGAILEGDYLKVGLTNLLNEMIHLKKVRVKEEFSVVMDSVLPCLIEEVLQESQVDLSSVLGIGIGIPAIYNVKKKMVEMAPLIGIHEREDISSLIQTMERRFRLPVIVDNDLNMEVQGEFIHRKLKGSDDLIYLSVGTGIGSGVMLNGKLRRGSHYMCGEVGYMTLSENDTKEDAGAGRLESKINMNALSQRFQCDNLSELGESEKEAAIDLVSTYVSLCINNMLMCYDCENISVGGEMFYILGEALFESIKKKTEELTIVTPQLCRSVKTEPGVVGAASVVAAKAMTKMLEE